MAKNKWLQELDELENEDIIQPDEEDFSDQEKFWDRDKKLVLFGAGGGFVLGLLVFLVITLISGWADKNSTGPEDAAFVQKLEKMNKRLASLEKGQFVMQESMAKIFKNTQGLEENFKLMDQFLKESGQQEIEPAEKDKEDVQAPKKQTSTNQKSDAEQAEEEQTEEKQAKDVQKRTHTVKAGENLYRISQRYGISLQKIRSLNDLGAKDKIYPGQELAVGTKD